MVEEGIELSFWFARAAVCTWLGRRRRCNEPVEEPWIAMGGVVELALGSGLDRGCEVGREGMVCGCICAEYSPAQGNAMFYAKVWYGRAVQDRLSLAERRGIYEEDRPVGFVGLMVLRVWERKIKSSVAHGQNRR